MKSIHPVSKQFSYPPQHRRHRHKPVMNATHFQFWLSLQLTSNIIFVGIACRDNQGNWAPSPECEKVTIDRSPISQSAPIQGNVRLISRKLPRSVGATTNSAGSLRKLSRDGSPFWGSARKIAKRPRRGWFQVLGGRPGIHMRDRTGRSSLMQIQRGGQVGVFKRASFADSPRHTSRARSIVQKVG